MTVQGADDPGRDIRASHADREAVVTVLRDAFVAGRLALNEFDERTSAAYAGQTWGELRVLTADLPQTPEIGVDPPAPPDGPPAVTERAATGVRNRRRPRLWPVTLVAVLGIATDSWLLAAVAVVTGVVSLVVLSLIEGSRLRQ
jgi:hypothetical protein